MHGAGTLGKLTIPELKASYCVLGPTAVAGLTACIPMSTASGIRCTVGPGLALLAARGCLKLLEHKHRCHVCIPTQALLDLSCGLPGYRPFGCPCYLSLCCRIYLLPPAGLPQERQAASGRQEGRAGGARAAEPGRPRSSSSGSSTSCGASSRSSRHSRGVRPKEFQLAPRPREC